MVDVSALHQHTTVSFPQILAETGRIMLGRWKSLTAGIAIMGFLFFSLQVVAAQVREGFRTHRISAILLTHEMEKLASLQRQSELGDRNAAAQLTLLRARAATHASAFLKEGFSFSSGEVADVLVDGSFSILFFLVFAALSVLWMLVILLLPSEADDPSPVLRRSCRLFFRFLRLLALMLFFSFLWIPLFFVAYVRCIADYLQTVDLCILFLSFGASIVMVPTFLMAPFLFAREGLSPFESIRESARRSRGYWGMLVCSIVGAVLCAMILLFWLHDVSATLIPAGPALTFADSIIAQCVMVLMLLFLRSVSHSILGYDKVLSEDTQTSFAGIKPAFTS